MLRGWLCVRPLCALVAVAALVFAASGCDLGKGDTFGHVTPPRDDHFRWCNYGEPESIDPALVPEGEFLYGNDKQRLSLSAFYMDKFEVSTAQYAKFMAATGAKEPKYWPTSGLVSHDQKPVVGVSWFEADAYCRH